MFYPAVYDKHDIIDKGQIWLKEVVTNHELLHKVDAECSLAQYPETSNCFTETLSMSTFFNFQRMPLKKCFNLNVNNQKWDIEK